jgi:hypothetical protein
MLSIETSKKIWFHRLRGPFGAEKGECRKSQPIVHRSLKAANGGRRDIQGLRDIASPRRYLRKQSRSSMTKTTGDINTLHKITSA